MPQVITKEELVASLPPVATIMDAMKAAYVQYSDGKAWVAPVSHVLIEGQGDACIKAGYVKQQSSWVVKVAGGFPGNAALGLSNSQGVMLLFSQRTGELESVLADGGHLTDVRTAAAAALCVREFMPAGAQRLAVFGTGVIAKLVAEYCAPMFPAGQEKGAKFPTSKAHISAVFHSFRLIFRRAIISRNGLAAWMLFSERARAEHSR